ncbi:MAG: hypothetical protein AOA66_0061 [Candidatus Bathyarchaeota archaeon BA2]|nr:MAG: hypothetical protein AOA66_0061 [Candidatus Bathyarchaeota archaeon BA2]
MATYMETEKEELALKTMGVFMEEIVLTPEMKKFVEECIDEKLKEALGLVPTKKATMMGRRHLYDVWVGLLSFVTFASAYFTAASFLSFVPGVLVTLACIITLVLFMISR